MYERILVATDGSELAGRGVDAAVELAKKRSEERRGGKEGRSRWAQQTKKK